MRAAAAWCLFLFAAVMGNETVGAPGTTRDLPTDDMIAIVLKPSELLFGSCPKLPAQTINVRLQALKTKSGTIFRRKIVTDDVFACLAALGSHHLTASSIKECSEKTEATGFKMFRWDGGKCTGYSNGIPVNSSRCARVGNVVLYSVDVTAAGPVVSNIIIDFADDINITATWDVTPDSCFIAYRVSFNGYNTIVSDKLAIVGIDAPPLCAEYTLTVTPVDANSAVMGPEAAVVVVIPKALELSLTIQRGLSAIKAMWKLEYTCNSTKRAALKKPKSFEVTYGEADPIPITEKFEWMFRDDGSNLYCKVLSTSPSIYQNVSLVAHDDTGAPLAETSALVTDNDRPGRRYLTVYNHCIYYQTVEETPGGVGLTYDKLIEFCQQQMFSLPFYDDSQNQDLGYYIIEIAERAIGAHYVGLRKDSSGNWKWLDGSAFPVTHVEWAANEPNSSGDCAELNANRKLAAVRCDLTDRTIVCYNNHINN